MKKWFAILVSLLMVLSVPALAEVDGEDVGITMFSSAFGQMLTEGEAAQLDLDGDGAKESVTWKSVPLDEYDDEVVVEVVPASGEAITWHSGTLYSAWACVDDLDGDGVMELLVTGDLMSDDYATFCLHLADGALTLLPVANTFRGADPEAEPYCEAGYGMITAIGPNRLELTGSQDVLGTYFGSRTFTLKDGRLELNDDGLWHFETGDADSWEYRALTPKAEIAATFVDGDQQTEGALKVGERIQITASDRTSVAWFVTEDGREGFLSIAPDEENGWGTLVNGVSEEELFEYVPYAD